ncbi:hypothetical protein XcmpCFBP7700_12965 [Xanthomonas campestris]|uniref:hypothetical protein n=1 Tax=Xanthomonas campestris TaxID=339 RepID=UPI000E7400DA|nr:hypothetical protein [Xanthomonas campestris]RJU12000.1 hypothetical protein XcmpCFBP7700_12965 [Xanthomonas campestris]
MSKRWTDLTLELKPLFIGGIKHDDIQAEPIKQGSLGWELVNSIMPTPLSAALLVFKKEF